MVYIVKGRVIIAHIGTDMAFTKYIGGIFMELPVIGKHGMDKGSSPERLFSSSCCCPG
jgi:hypothetical protein